MEKVSTNKKINRRQFLEKTFLLTLGLGSSPVFMSPFLNDTCRAFFPKSNLHEAKYYRKLSKDKVQCELCFRRCIVSDGKRGFCRNRENRKGKYYTLVYAKPAALQIDPVEKEPSFHMIPGSSIFCLATASCNNRCRFCHNWHLSQRSVEEIENYDLDAKELVKLAQKKKCQGISFTYSEPTVFYEYMYDVAKTAKEKGLKTLMHTNGSMNTEPLLNLLNYIDAVTVDLKGFTEKFYREVSSSKLSPVLNTLKNIRESGKHLEIVNLVIPTLNDDMEKIKEMCLWIKENLGDDVPLHFTRFFPAYKLTSLPPTPVETLEQAKKIADEEGLQYVYIGNCPGHKANSTYCPQCKKRIIYRTHFEVYYKHVEDGKCKFCGHTIPGVWS